MRPVSNVMNITTDLVSNNCLWNMEISLLESIFFTVFESYNIIVFRFAVKEVE